MESIRNLATRAIEKCLKCCDLFQEDGPEPVMMEKEMFQIRNSLDFAWCCEWNGDLSISINKIKKTRARGNNHRQNSRENRIESIRTDGKIVEYFDCGKDFISIPLFRIISLNLRYELTPGDSEYLGQFLDSKHWAIESASTPSAA